MVNEEKGNENVGNESTPHLKGKGNGNEFDKNGV
jgi:hypothetical protein